MIFSTGTSSGSRAFYNAFIAYLGTDVGLKRNTIGKQMKTLKTFLNWANDMGLPVNPAYKKFKVPKFEKEIIALSQSELRLLEEIDLENIPRLDRIRDVFLFNCYTSLRYSDMEQLKPEHLFRTQEATELRLRSMKNGVNLIIPLPEKAIAILQKYVDKYRSLLPIPSSQRLNEYLKEVAKLAGIDKPIELTNIVGNRKVSKTIPKYQALTIHAGRRTFVSLMIAKGIPHEIIMKFTGHQDYRAFRRYAGVTEDTKRNVMKQVWD